MIVIFNKETGEIHQTIWADNLLEGMELSSDEDWARVEGNINPHELHLCKLKLDKRKQAIEVHLPIFGEWKGEGILRSREIIGHKKAEDIKIVMGGK